MRSLFILSALLAMLFVPAAQPQDADAVFWHGSYKEALEEARKTGKPIFLEFRCEP